MTIQPPDGLSDVIDRFDHVSMAVRSFDDVRGFLDLVVAAPFDAGFAVAGDFHWVQYTLPGGTRLELIATDSTDPEHFINRFLDERGPGLHHLTFRVHDIAAARDLAIERGFTVVGFDDSDPEWRELFLHPRSANGVLVQLAEFPEKGGP